MPWRPACARVHDLLGVLAVVEDRSELEILDDITNVSMDVHTVRAFPSAGSPGMIGLDDGVQAYESVRNLIVAANPFELSLRLAPSRPLRSARLSPIRFRRDHLPVLASAARELRERVTEEGVVVEGNVVRLHREGSGAGEISAD